MPCGSWVACVMLEESTPIAMGSDYAWIEATGRWDRYSIKKDQTYLPTASMSIT